MNQDIFSVRQFYHIFDYPIIRVLDVRTLKIDGKLILQRLLPLNIYGRGGTPLSDSFSQYLLKKFEESGIPDGTEGFIKTLLRSFDDDSKLENYIVERSYNNQGPSYAVRSLIHDPVLQRSIEQYISGLERLVGQEVKCEQVTPPLTWKRYIACNKIPFYEIPKTNYNVGIFGLSPASIELAIAGDKNLDPLLDMDLSRVEVGQLVWEGKPLFKSNYLTNIHPNN